MSFQLSKNQQCCTKISVPLLSTGCLSSKNLNFFLNYATQNSWVCSSTFHQNDLKPSKVISGLILNWKKRKRVVQKFASLLSHLYVAPQKFPIYPSPPSLQMIGSTAQDFIRMPPNHRGLCWRPKRWFQWKIHIHQIAYYFPLLHTIAVFLLPKLCIYNLVDVYIQTLLPCIHSSRFRVSPTLNGALHSSFVI